MSDGLDDLPKRPRSHEVENKAVAAFDYLLSDCDGFQIQAKDRSDYGTDCQIEVMSGGSATNVRLHVQVKGTEQERNADGSISVDIRPQTLNYLLAQPHSFFVCCHVPSKMLFYQSADAVARDYEHKDPNWRAQKTITVRFSEPLTIERMHKLAGLARAGAATSRGARVAQTTASADRVPGLVRAAIAEVHVPDDVDHAVVVLQGLHENGQDAEISAAFDKFAAVLGLEHEAMTIAFMAEINLGMAGKHHSNERIAAGIGHLTAQIEKRRFTASSLFYSIGNGWSAMGREEEAVRSYEQALARLSKSDGDRLSAQIHKNLGTSHERLGDADRAVTHYLEAIRIEPDLAEARHALAIHYVRRGEFSEALQHIDKVVFTERTLGRPFAISGWRINILFNLGDAPAAFREINLLLADASKEGWIWGWCARAVASFGRASPENAQTALSFWEKYRRAHGREAGGERERLLTILYLRAEGLAPDLTYQAFKGDFEQSIELVTGEPAAYLWDRLGHWAQEDDLWEEAANCFRRAYGIGCGEYGYCLAVALNELGRAEECLPIALEQAERIQPDAMSWFQVALACSQLGRTEETVRAYEKAIELDPDDHQAPFNLGGTYWNSGDVEKARQIWEVAFERFPESELAARAKLMLAAFAPPSGDPGQ